MFYNAITLSRKGNADFPGEGRPSAFLLNSLDEIFNITLYYMGHVYLMCLFRINLNSHVLKYIFNNVDARLDDFYRG